MKQQKTTSSEWDLKSMFIFSLKFLSISLLDLHCKQIAIFAIDRMITVETFQT